MPITDELHDFEKKLETAIKSSFEKVFRKDAEFEISADYDTHSRINNVVAGLDLEVYGMSVTPSEFTITFEFCGAFEAINSKSKPRYCRLSLQNDGNYYLTLTEDDLKLSWYLCITDINFNSMTVPEEVMLECLNELKSL